MNFFSLTLAGLGYALFSYYLIISDEINKFISPSFTWLTYLTGFMLGVFLFVNSLRDISFNLKTFIRDTLKGIFLVYPIILFFAVKPDVFTEVNVPAVKTIPAGIGVKKQIISSLPTDNDGYVNLNLFELWLLARNYPELVSNYKFKTFGEVTEVTQKTLTLRRVFMTCCAADAMPVEVDVVINDKDFKKGDWISVSGKVIIRDVVVILPDYISKTKGPDSFYITRWSEAPPFNP